MESASLCCSAADHHAAPDSRSASFVRHLRVQNHSQRAVGNNLKSARLAQAFLEDGGLRRTVQPCRRCAELVCFDTSDPMASEVGTREILW